MKATFLNTAMQVRLTLTTQPLLTGLVAVTFLMALLKLTFSKKLLEFIF